MREPSWLRHALMLGVVLAGTASRTGLAQDASLEVPETSRPEERGRAVKVRVLDEAGRGVVPDRISCEQVRRGRHRIVKQSCFYWEKARRQIEKNGSGVVFLPDGNGHVFLRAHLGRRVSAPAILHENTFGRTYDMVFFRKRGRPPVVKRRPTYKIDFVDTPNLGRVAHNLELSVEFADPEGEPLRVFWFDYGEAAEAATYRVAWARVQNPDWAVMACDPQGNCTTAWVRVPTKEKELVENR